MVPIDRTWVRMLHFGCPKVPKVPLRDCPNGLQEPVLRGLLGASEGPEIGLFRPSRPGGQEPPKWPISGPLRGASGQAWRTAREARISGNFGKFPEIPQKVAFLGGPESPL